MKDAKAAPRLTVRRSIAAPAQELFDAWLDPEKLAEFMRPGDVRRTEAELDPRVGGEFELIMQTTSGPAPHTGRYREIDPPRRLAFTWNSESAGNNDSLVTVEFHPAGKGTEVVLTHEGLPSKDEAKWHTEGWTDGLKLLAANYEDTRASA